MCVYNNSNKLIALVISTDYGKNVNFTYIKPIISALYFNMFY